MNWKTTILVLTLFGLTLSSLAYKVNALNLDLFPKNKKDLWKIEYQIDVKASPETRDIRFPVPEASSRVKLLETQFEGKSLNLSLKSTKEGRFAYLKGISELNTKSTYRFLLQSTAKSFEYPAKDYSKKYPRSIQPFLEPFELTDNLESLVEKLEKEIIPPTNNKAQITKNIFYFVFEEILKNKKILGLEKTITNLAGSSRDKSNLITLLLRRQNIPARTVRGIVLRDEKETKRKFFYWNEAYLNKQWIPMMATPGFFAELPAPYIPMFTSTGLIQSFKQKGFKYEIHAHRVLSDEFSAIEYKKELKHAAQTSKLSSFFIQFSPYNLPLKTQPPLKLLLLFTVGCIVLSFSRNIIGIKTFGIFFPILLALFFKDTSLFFGLVFFFSIIFIGLFERAFLKKMHLLAVPRFSIILTLIVVSIFVFSILNQYYDLTSFSPTLLPIIITTMFIERFSITLEEEGWKNTLISFVGTLTITILTYTIFKWRSLEIFIYTHPEILFSVFGVQILIGKYTGYRLFELFRFRHFFNKKNDKDR